MGRSKSYKNYVNTDSANIVFNSLYTIFTRNEKKKFYIVIVRIGNYYSY